MYAFTGTSRELAVGPVAMISLLVAQGVAPLAQNVEQYVAFAVLLALMVGVTQLMMGVLRLGFLVNFLSHPVISGFTSAAALIIGFSQLKHLLGVDIARSSNIFEVLGDAWAARADWSLPTIAIGVRVPSVTLVALKRWKPGFPRALAVVVAGTLGVYLFDARREHRRAGALGSARSCRARDQLATRWSTLLPIALVISLVGFMESISVAKAFARKARYEVDPNQ